MNILIVIDRGRGRLWHAQLRDRLTKSGHRIQFRANAISPADLQWRVAELDMLLGLETLIYGAVPTAAMAPWRPPADELWLHHDIVIDLSTNENNPTEALVPLYLGQRGDLAAWSAVVLGQELRIDIAVLQGGDAISILRSGMPGIENRAIAHRALGFIAARAITLLCQSLEDGQPWPALQHGLHPVAEFRAPYQSALVFGAVQLAQKLARRLKIRTEPSGHWHIGWRFLKADGVTKVMQWPNADYQRVHDDGSRYYADPFTFVHEGITHVFCEEYSYATKRGIISAFTISQEGTVRAPIPVLERAYHLSYPHVFNYRDQIYMIPETSSNHTIELYRAEDFPTGWVLDHVLVQGIEAGDATFVEFAGMCWIFASIVGQGGSSWDQLAIFHAPSLAGPWTIHAQNPVMIDASCARPAGRMWVEDGVLWRVAQDCAGGYGRAISLARVDVLTTQAFQQTVVQRLPPRPEWGMTGLHTLNATQGLEVIDFLT